MSATFAQVIERASLDAAFRSQLESDPESALAGYALTAEERAALISRGPSSLEPLGLDVRNTKQGLNPGPGPVDVPMPTSDPFR
jgi:hypothetical protein